MSVGSLLHRTAPAMVMPEKTAVAAHQIAQVFLLQDASAGMPAAQAFAPLPLIRAGLISIWVCGFVAVLWCWLRQWLQTRALVRNATTLAMDAPVPVLCTPSAMEPGIFGVFRPVLLLPEGIARHLTPSHLDAILAHELSHVRRRDNLSAALHMLVQAVFWFHPLVWYIGNRLMEERERACDEAVLRAGKSPRLYAESILRTCQYYLESPAACVAGVTGADLKARIANIMGARLAAPLTLRKRVILAGAAGLAVIAPILAGNIAVAEPRGQTRAERFQFEVASIKPAKGGPNGFFIRMNPGAHFNASGITVKSLIEIAYDIKDAQLTGLPSWTDSERFEIDAKPDEATSAVFDKLPPDQRGTAMSQMLRTLLEDRFKFSFSREQRELPVYALVVAKSGPKLHQSTVPVPQNGPPGGPGAPRVMMNGRGELTATNATMEPVLNLISRTAGRPVIDKTGLTGRYDFTLKWTPDQSQGMMPGGPRPPGEEAPPQDSSGPSLFTALQEQLGLKLEPQKAPLDVLVVQHVERPTEN
jgi:uncharacterized protein (TIGR03435 family)